MNGTQSLILEGDAALFEMYYSFAGKYDVGNATSSKDFVQQAIKNCNVEFGFFKNILNGLLDLNLFRYIQIDKLDIPTQIDPHRKKNGNIAISVQSYFGYYGYLEENIVSVMKDLKITDYSSELKEQGYSIVFALPGGVVDKEIEVSNPDTKDLEYTIPIYKHNNLEIIIRNNLV